MSKTTHEQAVELAGRPYTLRIILDDSVEDEPLFVAINPELEGCVAQGETIQEAKSNLDEFRVEYILHLLENNLPIPEPAFALNKASSATGGAISTIVWQATSSNPRMSKQIIQHETKEVLLEEVITLSEIH